ncbi:MAG: hypothetical protein J5I90_19285 [Caldilineales bacterium]|nr:hypothetical protein [Caldilineales bacterium]
MSQTSPNPATEQTVYFDEEFDVRGFVAIVLRRWWVIALFTLIPAVTAFVLTRFMQDTFTAIADISLLNVRSVVAFDPEFTTIPEEAPAFSSDTGSRDQALLALAKSKSLVLEVYHDLVDEISPQETPFATMSGAMQVQNLGDLLRFEVTWEDPELAAVIANAWAQRYIQAANQSFVTYSSRDPQEARAVASNAFAEYQGDQEALESFIATDSAGELERQVAEIDAQIANLQEQQDQMLSIQANTGLIAANELAASTRDAFLSQIDYALGRQSEDRQNELNDWYERRASLQRLQLRLTDLRSQIELGAEGTATVSGDALAMMFIRAGMTDADSTPNLLLQIDPAAFAANDPVTVADVDEMLVRVAQGQAEATAAIGGLLAEMLSAASLDVPPDASADLQNTVMAQVNEILQGEILPADEQAANATTTALSSLTAQRQQLLAQQEKQRARMRELVRQRDSSWNLYETLDNKAREVEAQFAAGSPQARIAIVATPPLYRNSRNTIPTVLAAAAMGFVLGVLFVTTQAYWSAK